MYLDYFHWVSCATKDHSMDDAAFEAYKVLHARRFKDMMDDQYTYLPFYHRTSGWAMMEPEHYEDPTTKVMIDFTHEPLKQNERLEDELEVH